MNKAEREHLDKLSQLGCVICGAPAEIHHLLTGRHSQRKASHFRAIALCPTHHRLGPIGTAVHAGIKSWRWDEETLLAETERRLKELEANTI